MTQDDPRLAEISRVLERHAESTLAIPGVEGLAIGLLDNGRTPCLQILVVERTSELEARLPKTLDGHPVAIVVSGGLRPLDGR
jgi:hypothetical protein